MLKPVRVRATVRVLLSVTVLLIANSFTASAQSTLMETGHTVDTPSDLVLKEEHISVLKSALNLRPQQERLWVPVEVALQEMARWQASTPLGLAAGDRVNSRSSAAVATRIKRIAAIAAPLIKTLDENQKNSMVMLARSAGLEHLLAGQ